MTKKTGVGVFHLSLRGLHLLSETPVEN